jgi:hypothetical protein
MIDANGNVYYKGDDKRHLTSPIRNYPGLKAMAISIARGKGKTAFNLGLSVFDHTYMAGSIEADVFTDGFILAERLKNGRS